jgi:hypothetical protein
MRQFNLVLATLREDPEDTAADLESIARHVEAIDPRIRAVVLRKGRIHRLLRSHLWALPSLSIVGQLSGRQRLLPGRLLTSRLLLKDSEYKRLAAAGFPVPKWTLIAPDTVLDPAEWGPYVVKKPNDGGRGANVRIKRVRRVRYEPPETLETYGRRGMLAQEFIYTGEWPQSFRVMTLLGQAILCYHQITIGRGKPLLHRWGFEAAPGTPVVSNTRDMQVTMVKDPEVISLCERAHRSAFPDVPLLGFDVIRDAETGKLYILECHPHGPSWLFSSISGRSIQEKSQVDFVAQYDGLRKCAEILAEATPRLAARRLPFQSLDGRWA